MDHEFILATDAADTWRGAEPPTIDAPTMDSEECRSGWANNDDCESAVGCEFGCRCRRPLAGLPSPETSVL